MKITDLSETVKGKSEKTKPELLTAISKKVNLSEPTVIIGDTKFDIQGGKEFGIKTLGITTGSDPRKELEEAGADFIIDDIKELLDIIG